MPAVDRVAGSPRARSRVPSPEPRNVKILLVRLRLIGDVVFTTPIPRALKRAFPDSHVAYLVEPQAAPVVAGNPHLDEVIVAPRPQGIGADRGGHQPGAAAAARAVRCRDRPARRTAKLLADAGDRSASADRVRHPGTELDVHAHGGAAACAPPAAFGRQSVGPAGGDRGVAAEADRSPDATPWRWRRDEPADARISARLRGRRHRARARADRRARQRRQSVPAVAGAGVHGARRGARGRLAAAADRVELRAVRP